MRHASVPCAVFRENAGQVRIDDVATGIESGPQAHATQPFPGIRQAFVVSGAGTEASVFTCAAGSEIPMHAGAGWSYCAVLSGEGLVATPDGSVRAYSGPAVFVFAPGGLHVWNSTSDTTIWVVYVQEPNGSHTSEGEA